MLVMLANNTGARVGYVAGKYGGIGHLYSPGAQRGPFEFLPYSLDNGRYPAFSSGKAWDEAAWLKMLTWAARSGQQPLWALVPDVVASRDGTLRDWDKYAPVVQRYGFRLAMAVQDGMEPSDVPAEAEVVFVGGTTAWKWRTLPTWSRYFKRVHVGRVNTYDRLIEAEHYCAESVDGTGWTRGDQYQWRGLIAFLEGKHRLQMQLEEAS